MRKIFNLLLLLSCVCSAQIDKNSIFFNYRKNGVIGEQVKVKFKVNKSDSIVVYKKIDNGEELVFKIPSNEYGFLISELEKTIKTQPKHEEFICSHGNKFDISFSVKSKPKNISSSCISSKMNSWSLKLLERFLNIIGEKEKY